MLRGVHSYKEEISEAIQLSVPIILGQLGLVLMGVADTMMVGRLGDVTLAAANQSNNVFFLVVSLSIGVLFAISTLVSIKDGEGRPKDALTTYRAGLWVASGLFVFQFLVLEIITRNFHWLGQDAGVEALAPEYLRIINISGLPMLIFQAARQYSDGLGKTLVSMMVTIGGLLMNVWLNWAMIYGHMGFEPMGLNGAGYATLISRVAMAVVLVAYIYYSPKLRAFRPEVLPSFSAVKKEIREVIQIGIPVGIQFFAEVACFALSGVMVGWLGAIPLAAHAVALNVASATFMAVSGLATAGSIMTGNAFGEKNKERLRRVSKTILWSIVVFEVINAALFLLFKQQIANAYGVREEAMKLVLPLMILAAIFQLADGIQVGAMNLLRGIKDVRMASFIAITAYWVVSLPLSYFLGFTLTMGVYGIWTGFTIALFIAAVLGVMRFYYRLKTLNFEQNDTNEKPGVANDDVIGGTIHFAGAETRTKELL